VLRVRRCAETREIPQGVRCAPEAQERGYRALTGDRGPRVSQPPVARNTPTDHSTGARPIDPPTAPNTSGTATAIELTSDMRTPAASPMRPGGAWLCSRDITIGWLAPSPSPRQNESVIS